MTPAEELIREIATTHGIAVGRDDPIMILHTINRRLLMDSHNVQQELLRKFQEELEAAAKRWGDDSKNRAEKILNAALTASRQTMDAAANDSMNAIVSAMRQEVDRGAGKMNSALSGMRWLFLANLGASLIMLSTAVVMFAMKA